MPTRRALGCWLAVLTYCVATPAQAMGLLEGYEAALAEDAEFHAARAAAEAGRAQLPMARAQLLPNLSLSVTQMRNDLTAETKSIFGPVTNQMAYNSSNYALTLRQPLYRPSQYAGYRQAEVRVESVEALFDKARQDLALRLIEAYLNLLFAEESLRQIEIQGVAIEAQLAAASRALALGQGTRTDVDDAQARLDLNRSRALGARQQIDQARHELRILVNRPVDRLQPLVPQRMELGAPQADGLDEWIARAEMASPDLRDMEARRAAAQWELERAKAGHKPTLDLVAQRSLSENDNITNPNSRYDNRQIGLQLSIPLFAGGYVDALVTQALAQLEEAEARLETLRRRLAAQVRKEFQAVREGIERIRALEQAERSAAQSLRSTEKGLLAGTRTRLDILNAQQNLATTQLELVRERLNYVKAHARLHALSGALDYDAVARLARWFGD